jgi:hypothetical protein
MPHSPMPNRPPPVFYVRGSIAPKTNAKRQAAFRKRHPNYNREYKARIRAALKAAREARIAATIAAPAPAVAEQVPVAPPATKPQLLLPAPVEMPVLPGINTIGETHAERLERVAVWYRNATARASERAA